MNETREFLKTLTMMRQSINDDLNKAKMKPFDYERWKVGEDIRRAKIGSNIDQPLIAPAMEQVVREWAASGQRAFLPEKDAKGMPIAGGIANAEQLNAKYPAILETLNLLDQQRASEIEKINRKEREDEAKTVDAITQERERMQKSLADMNGTRLDQIREATDYELAQERKRIGAIKGTTEQKKALLDDFAAYAKKKSDEVALITGDNWGAGFGRGMNDWIGKMKSGFEYAKDMANSTAQAMSQSFGDFFFDVMTGKIKKLSDYITGFLTSIARAMANVMGEMAARQLITGAMGMFSGGVPSGGTTMPATGGSPSVNMANVAANGAVWNGGFQAFATGGVVSKPTLGLVGEGRYNEAIIPLPDGKAVPVVMRGGSATSAPKVTINVINQTGQQANARSSQPRFDGLGNMIIDVVLDALNRNVNGFRDAVGAV
jgi:lambda family phage tail tape measure protein